MVYAPEVSLTLRFAVNEPATAVCMVIWTVHDLPAANAAGQLFPVIEKVLGEPDSHMCWMPVGIPTVLVIVTDRMTGLSPT